MRASILLLSLFLDVNVGFLRRKKEEEDKEKADVVVFFVCFFYFILHVSRTVHWSFFFIHSSYSPRLPRNEVRWRWLNAPLKSFMRSFTNGIIIIIIVAYKSSSRNNSTEPQQLLSNCVLYFGFLSSSLEEENGFPIKKTTHSVFLPTIFLFT